jgi:hypothetical protein
MIHMVRCVLFIFVMSYICTKKIIAQVISNAIKVVLIQQKTHTKCFWSYLNQFLTIFDDPGTENEVNMCGGKVQYALDERPVATGFNWFFIGPTIFFKTKDQQLD